jgi:hypothetical protein
MAGLVTVMAWQVSKVKLSLAFVLQVLASHCSSTAGLAALQLRQQPAQSLRQARACS